MASVAYYQQKSKHFCPVYLGIRVTKENTTQLLKYEDLLSTPSPPFFCLRSFSLCVALKICEIGVPIVAQWKGT